MTFPIFFTSSLQISSRYLIYFELQQDNINRIKHWSNQWQLPLNAQKCSKLHVSGKNGEGIDSNAYYSIDQKDSRQIEIKDSEETIDLRVVVDTKLKFQKQFANCIEKNERLRGFDKEDDQVS